MPWEHLTMRRPRLRMSVRRLMIAVALIAMVLAMRRTSAVHHKRAEAYAWITFHTGSAVLVDGQFVDRDPVARVRDAWAWKMAEKYWRLSDYPWMPVVPDKPPPPEALAELTESLEPPMESGPTNWSLRPISSPAWTFLWTWRP